MSPRPSSADERLAALQDELATQIMNHFCALEQVSRLYDLKNAAVGKIIRELVNAVQQFARETGEPLCLTVSGHSYFVNRRLIRFSIQAYRRAQQMSAVWSGLGVGEITFPRDFTLPAGEEFIARFVAGLKDAAAAPALFDRAWGGVMVRGPVKETGLDERIDPREAAIRTYSALVVLVREMLVAVKAGQQPSTLPIRRCLQTLVDQSAHQQDLLLMLSRRLAPRRELAVHLANVSLYALLIGRRLELGRSTLLSLASAALYHDLPKASLGEEASALEQPQALGPEERDRLSGVWLKTVRRLLETGSLTDDMLTSLVVMDEAELEFGRPDLQPEPGRPAHSLFSAIIAVADRFDTAARGLLGGQLSMPDQATGALLESAGKELHAGLVRLFVETVGLFPLGSVLLLSTGELGLVTAVSDPQHADRPSVNLIADIRRPAEPLAGSVDLSLDKQRRVAASADPSRLGMNPVAVFRPT